MHHAPDWSARQLGITKDWAVEENYLSFGVHSRQACRDAEKGAYAPISLVVFPWDLIACVHYTLLSVVLPRMYLWIQ